MVPAFPTTSWSSKASAKGLKPEEPQPMASKKSPKSDGENPGKMDFAVHFDGFTMVSFVFYMLKPCFLKRKFGWNWRNSKLKLC